MSVLEYIYGSANWLTLVTALVVCLAVYLVIAGYQKPAGPMGLPYLGLHRYLTDNAHLELLEMSKKYGRVFCFKYTGQLYAHIMDMKTIREITSTKSDCFENRPTSFTLFKDIFVDGLFDVNGELWKVLRKFFVREFKEIGMGKQTQEAIVHGCLTKIVSALNESGGKNFDGLHFISGITNGVIGRMIFGDVAINKKDATELHSSYTAVTEYTIGTKILLAGSYLKYFLIPFAPEFSNYRKHKNFVDSTVAKIIRQHDKEFDRNNIRNLIDMYINQKRMLEEKNDPSAKFFTERYLIQSITQFLGDGALGVPWITASILQIISSHSDVQKKVQAELDEVVGRERFPSMDDRSRLSYTTATVYEGLRTIMFFPLLPVLECTKETTIEGCRIPKGTIILYNLWAVFHDPDVYDNPEKFDPTRFLSDGKKPKCEIPIMFGIGKRSCIGESFCSMQILLYVATVLQHFDIHPPDGSETKTEWNITFRATPRKF